MAGSCGIIYVEKVEASKFFGKEKHEDGHAFCYSVYLDVFICTAFGYIGFSAKNEFNFTWFGNYLIWYLLYYQNLD